MQRNFRINVDGRSYTVAVEEISADGFPAPVPASSHVAAQVAPPAQVAAPSAPVAPAQSAPAGSVSGQDVLAPLAGVVDSIDVRVGQAVNAGDRVAVIEAMKMKTDVFSKTSGTIKSIFVKIKDSVDTDQPILNIG